jgi:uncharacterized protein DUF3303
MKFMLTFTMKPEVKGRDEAIAQFKKTGGQPPKGAKLLGRWTAADFSGGYDLQESDDAEAFRIRAHVERTDGAEGRPCGR